MKPGIFDRIREELYPDEPSAFQEEPAPNPPKPFESVAQLRESVDLSSAVPMISSSFCDITITSGVWPASSIGMFYSQLQPPAWQRRLEERFEARQAQRIPSQMQAPPTTTRSPSMWRYLLPFFALAGAGYFGWRLLGRGARLMWREAIYAFLGLLAAISIVVIIWSVSA